ncbi:hypothetical protein BZG04_00590 [Salinivibrio kushneri]|nr:hypothetical protein BZG04_00590 [Salinivibrio kushneri]OOE61386.1 hypothetical protein BZG18_08075 [Salinivibrio kushneri]
MKCLIPGCDEKATNNLSVRLRREDTSAIWAPNTEAYICNTHASHGFNVFVDITPRCDDVIETRVCSGTSDVKVRQTVIKHAP